MVALSAGITSLSLQDVRCFADEQRAKLSKATLLVGENSTGKSTFLGCLNGLAHLIRFVDLYDQTNCFDLAPFEMGSFGTVVRSGSPSFRVGIGLEDEPLRNLKIEFVEGPGSSPLEKTLALELANGHAEAAASLTIDRQGFGDHAERWHFDGPCFEFNLDRSDVSHTQFTTWLSRSVRYGWLPFSGEITQFKKRRGAQGKGRVHDEKLAAFGKFVNFFRHRFRVPEAPFSIKPIDPQGFERRRSYPFDPLGIMDGSMDPEALNDAGRSLKLFDRIGRTGARPHANTRFWSTLLESDMQSC